LGEASRIERSQQSGKYSTVTHTINPQNTTDAIQTVMSQPNRALRLGALSCVGCLFMLVVLVLPE
jgi:hypothetical protein